MVSVKYTYLLFSEIIIENIIPVVGRLFNSNILTEMVKLYRMLKFKISKLSFLLLICIFAFCLLPFALVIHAQGCPATDYTCQIEELQKEADARKDAHEKNKSDLAAYQKELASLQKKLADLDKRLKDTEKQIREREISLGIQEELLSARLREMYKRGREFSFFTLLFSSRSISDLSQGLALRRTTAQQDWQIITSTSEKILSLKKDKETLKKNQASLSGLKAQVDKQATFLAGEVAKTETFFSQIKAKQSELLALKAGGFSTSVGDVPPADDPASRPDYNPGFSPAYGVFSFGAPHRKGMSQYGAFGRAKAGESAEEILKTYYGNVRVETRSMPGTISTSIGTLAFEDRYLRGIAEMPAVWADQGGFEALKAQAIAARTYALVAGKPICITEACQVYSRTKNDSRWNRAVDETRGKVVVSNATGNMFSTMYASTAGGYVFSYSSAGHSTPGLWDTPSGRNGWTNEAYEKIAGSPWFYKAWYRTRSNVTYGRSHPWLTMEEFTDIINALLIYKGNSSDVTHLSFLDSGVSDTWSMSKVKEEAGKYGGPVTSISGNPDVVYSNDGYTAKVYFETDKGRKEFNGEDFKYIFNLRAPGAIGIKSSLFNIMKK